MTSLTSHGLPPKETPLAESRAAADPKDPPKPSATRAIIEWVVVIAIAVVLALVVRAYVVQTFYIPSPSMEPTLQIGDRILVLKAAYDFTSPAIGDVIVFRAPPKEHLMCSEPEVQDLVKRIIALPGDTISSKGNTIYIDGKPLVQPWQHTSQLGPAIRPQTIPPNQYFVMGDNRPDSCDSRVWGTVPRANIIGKAIVIFWPLSRISTI
jgi:signal peptidase I